jgi:response regulator RpfG family c-di-GMP phosphodiesterase
MSTKQALLQIRDGAGKKYDPEVVKAMLIAYRRGGLFNEDETFFEIPF